MNSRPAPDSAPWRSRAAAFDASVLRHVACTDRETRKTVLT